MKILELIWACLLVICTLGMTIWQVSIKAPVFPVVLFFIMCFLSIAILCKVLKEFYDNRK